MNNKDKLLLLLKDSELLAYFNTKVTRDNSGDPREETPEAFRWWPDDGLVQKFERPGQNEAYKVLVDGSWYELMAVDEDNGFVSSRVRQVGCNEWMVHVKIRGGPIEVCLMNRLRFTTMPKRRQPDKLQKL